MVITNSPVSVPIINVEWKRVVGVVFRCRCRADIYSSILYLVIVKMYKISKGESENFLIWTKKYG